MWTETQVSSDLQAFTVRGLNGVGSSEATEQLLMALQVHGLQKEDE